MKTEYLPFSSEMIPEAGKLLAKRHICNRQVLPLLPARYEDPQAASKAVENLWQSQFRNGYAALRNGEMLAYLIGDFENQPWARSGYVYLPGYALASGESVAILQDLYALLGEDWVRRGIFSHNLYISAADHDVIQGFFTIGFGQERVDALLDLRTLEIPSLDEPEGMMIRRAGKGDEAYLGSVAYVMINALSSAPYWLPVTPESTIEWQERWASRADNEEWMVWMALEKDKAVGTAAFLLEHPTPLEQDAELQMLASAGTVTLGTAATRPEARGRGVANILTWRGLEQARGMGFDVCLVNWIGPNLLASRYWLRFGFQPAAYRLSKQLHPQIAWARDE
jgi:GNAT superfamily N-acetyltransferase